MFESIINIKEYGTRFNSDLGAQINAADRFLGADPGKILIPPGNYTIATQISLSDNRGLHFGAGHYACTITTAGLPLAVVGDNVTISGDGWNAQMEPPFSWEVFANGSDRGPVNLLVRDLHFISGPSGMPVNEFSAGGTVVLGNGTNCRVEHCFFDNVTSYGVQIGGGNAHGNHANGCWVIDCLFEGVLSANIAYVNGQNVVIIGNIFRNPGRGIQSTTCIDLEENSGEDILRNWTVANNVFDLRKDNTNVAPTAGVGVQGGSSGTGTISGNTFIGSDNVPDFSTVSVGVYLHAAKNVLVSSNNFNGIFYNGGVVRGTDRCAIIGNRFKDAGDGPPPFGSGNPVVSIIDSTFVTVQGNSFYSQLQGYNSIVESGSSNNNFYFGNYFEQIVENFTDPAFNPRIILVGANSRAYDNIFSGRKVDGAPARRNRRRVNADAPLKDTDDILGIDTSGGAVTLSLPDPASAAVGTDMAALAFLIQIEVGGNTVTLRRFGAEKINGNSADYTFSSGRVTIYSDGIDWYAA